MSATARDDEPGPADAVFDCPYCERPVYGWAGEHLQHLLHSGEPCERYVAADALEILKDVREQCERRGAKRAMDLPPIVREMIAMHEALRKLGFPSDDIFAEVVGQGDGTSRIGMSLRTQGKNAHLHMAAVPDDAAMYLMKTWEAAAERVNAGAYKPEDLDEVWTSSEVYANRGMLVAFLAAHGFQWPKAFN